ncbi:hypothetical protein IB286_06925 [Spongiibacter sp. KMU-158]|uniref:Uncharacterized protein n=1 Tax=Spongiibacter pelagi TaxID=2760804 RepID=A0A927C2B8_9GAMM|nr:hypothetical protein [Spongiibacter pelagi]MBD2858742.1 hypothetical protein [Spongiibacter pelagi]
MKEKGLAALVLGTLFALPFLVVNKMDDVPSDVQDSNGTFCTIGDLAYCREGDWFGMYSSELPSFAKKSPLIEPSPLAVLCQDFGRSGGIPNPQILRILPQKNGDKLYLCRLRAAADIETRINNFAP